MENTKRYFALAAAFFLAVSFLIAIFWTHGLGLLLLTVLALGACVASFFYPRAAFAVIIIMRTAADFLTGQEIFSIGGLGVNFTSLMGVIVIIFAVSTFIKHKGWREKIPLFGSWTLFLFLAAVLSFFSISFGASLVEFLRWLSFFALFLLGFYLFRGGQALTRLIRILIASSIIPTAVALWQALNHQGVFDGERWRLNGTFVHPNMLAFYLVFVITLACFIFLSLKKQWVEKYLYLFLAVPFLLVLVLTYTRGAWLCLFMIIFLIGLVRFRTLLLAGAGVIIIFYLAFSPFQERINSLMSFSATDSTVWRVDLWRDAIGYAQGSPAIGYGPGTAPIVIGNYRPVALGSSEPHNDYIKILLETGIIGLAAYLALIINLLARLFKGFKNEAWPRRQNLFLFILVFAASLYLFSAGDNILKDSSLQWSFWALNGAMMFAYLESKRDKADMTVE